MEMVIRTCPCDVLILFKQLDFRRGVSSVLQILASSAKRTVPRKVSFKMLYSENLNKGGKKSPGDRRMTVSLMLARAV